MTPARHIRHRLDMTQQEVAAAVGVTQATISRWEAAQRLPGEAVHPLRDLGRERLKRAWRDEWLFSAPAAAGAPSEHVNTTEPNPHACATRGARAAAG